MSTDDPSVRWAEAWASRLATLRRMNAEMGGQPCQPRGNDPRRPHPRPVRAAPDRVVGSGGDVVNALAYFRVSTDSQGPDGYGMDAQRAVVGAYAASHGLSIDQEYQDVSSGKTLAKRPGLKGALERLEDKSLNGSRPQALIVAKLDRLSRSMLDFARMIERSQERGWTLIVVEPEIDMTTPYGRAMANVIMTFAQLERELISDRTKVAMAAAKRKGVAIGRPRTMPDDLMNKIRHLRASGLSLKRTAKILNEAGLTGPQGGRWHDRTVMMAEWRYGTKDTSG